MGNIFLLDLNKVERQKKQAASRQRRERMATLLAGYVDL